MKFFSPVFLSKAGQYALLLLPAFLPGNKSFTQKALITAVSHREEYTCIPCGNDCDNEVYNEPGTCKYCNMPLVKKSAILFKNITPDELCKIVSTHKNVVLLDVRSPEEFTGKAGPNYGHLKNAININIKELDKKMDELKAWKNKEIIVYCSHSHRSPQASYMLTQNGFTNVRNMLGGMSTWEESVKNNPLAKKLLIK